MMPDRRLGLAPEVIADVPAVEDVDALEAHDHPGQLGAVDDHGRADAHGPPELGPDQRGGLVRLVARMVELWLLADRAVIEHAPFSHDRQAGVEPLRIEGEDTA